MSLQAASKVHGEKGVRGGPPGGEDQERKKRDREIEGRRERRGETRS